MTAKVQVCLQGPVDHLRIVWQTGEALLEGLAFPEDPDGTRYNVLLAVQEMVTNVLRHAYSGRQDVPVVVEFTADRAGIDIEIRDRGVEFNPALVDAEPPGEEEFPTSEGGYGIMITRMVMDEFEYRRDGEWNVVRLYKSVQPAASTAPRS